jgi:hypothetical protein
VIVMTGEERVDADDLLRAGADHVLIPGEITGERALDLLLQDRSGERPATDRAEGATGTG